MVVVEVLLACNLVLMILCATRGAARRKPRLEDLLAQVQRPETMADESMAVIVPFPGPDLARRRAMANHPSAHDVHPSLYPAHPSVR